ncbi:MAG: proton-conducting transporter membrane subunit, partial [Bacteroidia bacterium]
KLNNQELVHEHLQQHSWVGIFISLMLLLAAAAKSAQLPFSSWLPRAMEGPTPSSAIFYGSLSVHFGAFLLMRTYPFWQEQTAIKILIILLGFSTSIIATLISKVQSTIKTQIAYASIAQIGLMFIEIALGFTNLALFHFMGNAFLRSYQLLISPSVVTYLIREQFYEIKKESSRFNKAQNKLKNTFYVLSVKEWNLDSLTNKLLFTPLKKIGKKLDFITINNVLYILLPIYTISLIFYMFQDVFHPQIYSYLPELFSIISFVLVLKSFSERKHPRLAWTLILFSQLWIALAISFNEKFDINHTFWFLSGSIIAFVVGLACLNILRKKEKHYFNLNQYYGHVYEYPKLSFVFLMSAMALMGFPITPSFIGEDLLLSHIHQNQVLLAFFVAFSYIMSGIALIRIYARLFLGNHIKTYHETALKST